MTLRSLINPYATEEEEEEETSPGFLGRARDTAVSAGIGTLRGVGQALEPINIAQDYMFAATMALRDDDLSFTDAFGRLNDQFGDYFDFYDPRRLWEDRPPEFAERFATGQDIAGALFGLEGNAQKYVGFGLDLFADPLVLGSWVRLGGRAAGGAARLAGAGADTTADFVRAMDTFGRGIDNVTNTLGNPFNQAAGLTRYTYHTATRRSIENDMQDLIGVVLNRTVPGMASNTRFISDQVRRREMALRGQFRGDPFDPNLTWQQREARGELGAELLQGERAGRALGEMTADTVMGQMEGIAMMFGRGPARRWMRRVGNAIGIKSRAERLAYQNLSVQTGDTIIDAAYNVQRSIYEPLAETQARARRLGRPQSRRAQQQGVGLAFTDPQFSTLPDNRVSRSLLAAEEEVRKGVTGFQRFEANVRLEEARRRVRSAAKEAGDDPDEALEAFHAYHRRVAESDALVGYELSMYGPVAERVIEIMDNAGLPGVDIWKMMVARGARERPSQLTRVPTGQIDERTGRPGWTTIADMTKDEAGKPRFTTVGDVLAETNLARGLSIDDFVKSLHNGHLYRAFGSFTDPEALRRQVRAAREGKIIASNLIDDGKHLEQNLVREHGSDVGGRVAQYIQGVVQDGTNRHSGRLVTQEQISRYLQQDLGLSRAEAAKVFGTILKSVNSTKYGEFIGKLDAVLERHINLFQEGGETLPRLAAADLDPTLERMYLEAVGEVAEPLVSLANSARLGNRLIPANTYVNKLFEVSQKGGYVRNSFKEGWSPISDTAAQAGPFAGTWVHPVVAKELRLAAGNQMRRAGRLERMVQLISGAYLAGPKSVSANIGGGIYTTMLYGGISGVAMLASLARTLPEVMKEAMGRDYRSPLLDRLRGHYDLNTIRASDIAGDVRRIDVPQLSGMDTRSGFIRGINKLADKYRELIGFMGLDAFQNAEVWMKAAAFDAAERSGRFTAGEAAELSRMSTFDYSELPEILQIGKRSGLLLFPGFPYFMTGRLVKGVLERPGIVGAANRIPAAAVEASDLSDEEKFDYWVAIENSWMKENGGGPMPFFGLGPREDEGGNAIVPTFPYQQMFPTQTLTGDNWWEVLTSPQSPFGGVATFGIARPIIDILTAPATEGQGAFNLRFGGRVYNPEDNQWQQFRDTMGFLMSSYSPQLARQFLNYQPGAGEGFSGILPDLFPETWQNEDAAIPAPGVWGDYGYSLQEFLSNSVARTPREKIVSSLIRTVTPVATGGPAADVIGPVMGIRAELWENARNLAMRRLAATERGDFEEAERLTARLNTLIERAMERLEAPRESLR